MKPFFLFALLSCGFNTFSQNELPEQFLGFSVWSQRMDMTGHVGRKYRLTVAIRAEPANRKASAQAFIRNEPPEGGGPDKWISMDNMTDRPVRSKKWQTYLLTGTVDKETPWIAFGCLNIGNGTFYYDDLRLSVETSPNEWTTLHIPNGGFESETLSPWEQTSGGGPARVHGANAELFSENPFEGEQCLRVKNKLLVKN